MEHKLKNTAEILEHYVCGFRRYLLQKPAYLDYVSENLCALLCCSKEELLGDHSDRYMDFVHPADQKKYKEFLHQLMQGEQTRNVQYRLIPRDGEMMYVSDTATCVRLDDGTPAAYSTLTDITRIKAETSDLHFLNETIPFGFVRYTCEKQPRVTYINEQMLRILRFTESDDGEPDDFELYKDNIFLMIPMEERRKFSHFLNQVNLAGGPISGELTVLRCDGTKVRLYGWVSKSVNEQGQEEFQSVCMDITQRHQTKQAADVDRYLKALSEVYDKIFEYDLNNQTVKCLYGEKSDMFRHIQNIPMHIEQATEQWIREAVAPEDRETIQAFFRTLSQPETGEGSARPLQIKYRARSSNGSFKTYTGIVLKVEPKVNLFCCRSVADDPALDQPTEEKTVSDNVFDRQEMLANLSKGIVAFEVEHGCVKPLFTSDNVCEFFGYSRDEWFQLTQETHSLDEFVSQSSIPYEEFKKLFEQGEAEFFYLDLSTQTKHSVKAVCSRKFADDSAPFHVMLYNVNDHMRKSAEGQIRTYIRTFGYFDVFVDEKPIPFRNKKSKELLALLVDRRGGYVSSEEAIGFLWEEEEVNAVTLSRYRKVALRLKNILEEYGIADIVESVDGKRRLVTEEVRCDLYDYLSQSEEFSQLFKGSYLSNYSWGEVTLGELLREY